MTLMTTSLSPAATYISRAGEAPRPRWSVIPPLTAAALFSSVCRLSGFFSLAAHARNSAPESKFRSPAVRNSAPLVRTQRNSAPIPHPVSHSGWVIGSRSGIRLAAHCGQHAQGSKHRKKLQRSRFCRPLYIYIVSQVRSSSTLFLLDRSSLKRTHRPVFRVARPHGRQSPKSIALGSQNHPVSARRTPFPKSGTPVEIVQKMYADQWSGFSHQTGENSPKQPFSAPADPVSGSKRRPLV
jgi:hypothetical protein